VFKSAQVVYTEERLAEFYMILGYVSSSITCLAPMCPVAYSSVASAATAFIFYIPYRLKKEAAFLLSTYVDKSVLANLASNMQDTCH